MLIFFLQVAWAMKLATPWYMPIGGTLAALMVTYALISALKLVVLWCGPCLHWAGWPGVVLRIGAYGAAPGAYAGPYRSREGAFPAFHARLADGTEISESFFGGASGNRRRVRSRPLVPVLHDPNCASSSCTSDEFARSQAVSAGRIDRRRRHDLKQTHGGDFPHLTVVSDEWSARTSDAGLSSSIAASLPTAEYYVTPTILLVDNSGTCGWLHRPYAFYTA